MRGALADRHPPGPWETPPVRRPCRSRGIRTPQRSASCPGYPIQAVHAHLPPRAQERPRLSSVATGLATCAKHLSHRSCPSRCRACVSPPVVTVPCDRSQQAPLSQGLRQPDPGLLVILPGEKGQRHREIHHDVRRELPAFPLRALPRRLDRIVDPRPAGTQDASTPREIQSLKRPSATLASLRHNPRSCRQPAGTPRSDTPGQIKINLS